MVLSSRATSNQATLKKLNLKSTGSFSTNQPKDNKFIDLSAEPTTSQSKSFTTTSTKSSNPRFSTQSKAINSINSTSKSSLNQERPRHSEIKSPNSNGNDRRGLKNSSNAGIKNVTPKGKSPMSSGKPYCDAMKSPEIFSSRLPTPKSKRAATISDSTSEEKSYPSPHCGLVKSNYDVDNVISPRNERNAQVRRASSPQAETPKAKRCLKLKPAQRQNPSTNSIGDSAKLRNDDVPNFSCNQTTELPTTSKSAFSPKLNPKSLKLDPKSPKVSSLHKVPVITNDGISGSALKANVIETHSDVSIETEDLTRSEIRRIKKKIERFFNSLDMHEMNPDNVTLKGKVSLI